MCKRSVHKYLAWALFYVSLHLITIILYYTEIYVPNSEYAIAYYIPYIFLSGPIAWFFAMYFSKMFIKYILVECMSISLGWELSVIWIPGLFNVIAGFIQWYLMYRNSSYDKR